MKIGPSNTDGLRIDGKTVGPERAPSVRDGSGSEPIQGSSAVDRVSLSNDRGALIGGAVGQTINEKKVEEVRRAIQEGRFPVDAKRVAEQLLADAADFLGLDVTAR